MSDKKIAEEAVTLLLDNQGKPEVMIRRSKDGGVDVFKVDMMGVDKFTKFLETLVNEKQIKPKQSDE